MGVAGTAVGGDAFRDTFRVGVGIKVIWILRIGLAVVLSSLHALNPNIDRITMIMVATRWGELFIQGYCPHTKHPGCTEASGMFCAGFCRFLD